MNMDEFLLWFYGLEPKYHIDDRPRDTRVEDTYAEIIKYQDNSEDVPRYASFYYDIKDDYLVFSRVYLGG